MSKKRFLLLKNYFLMLLCFGFVLLTKAQELKSSVAIDRILIGEPFEYTLSAEMPLNSVFEWPTPKEDTINEFEILEKSAIDTVAKGDVWQLHQKWTLTSYDSGFFVIPPQQLIWGIDTFFTEPILIQVDMPEVLEDVPIYEIKDIQKAPFNWLPLLWWGIGFVLAFIILFFIRRYWLNRNKVAPVPNTSYTPERPAHEIALGELAMLKKQALWKEDLFKEHYDQLTAILRKYIAKRFNIPAREYTTDQLLAILKARGYEAGLHQGLKQLFRSADMAKFAKGRTDRETAESLIGLVEEYITKTKLITENNTDNG